jgi:hypothetical protein
MPRLADALDSWVRAAAIIALIVSDAMVEEGRVLGAELMMLVRWTRDFCRYDLRWIVEEKLRLLGRRRAR